MEQEKPETAQVTVPRRKRTRREIFTDFVLPLAMIGGGSVASQFKSQLFPRTSRGIRVLSDPNWSRTETKKAPKKR